MLTPTIIYEDDDLLAINKPAGLLTHGSERHSGASLADWLLLNYPSLTSVGEDPTRPGLVHRLDKETSGLLVVAKNQKAFQFLKQQFFAHQIHKIYQALVYGELKPESGVIDWPVGRHPSDPRRRLAAPPGRALRGKWREARTAYQVLERFAGFSLVEARPQTGRTHQIRVHFKALGHPIVCDGLYAPGRVCPPPLARQALHAASLELTLPSGAKIKLAADLPEDFASALAQLRKIAN